VFLEGTLLEKLRKIEALHAGTTVDGEKEAAQLVERRSAFGLVLRSFADARVSRAFRQMRAVLAWFEADGRLEADVPAVTTTFRRLRAVELLVGGHAFLGHVGVGTVRTGRSAPSRSRPAAVLRTQ
jgi:hypothetical protein